MIRNLLTIALLLSLCGCTSLNVATLTWPAWGQPNMYDDVLEILAIWQPGEGRDQNGLPSRGFAGQVFFFTPGNASPVKISGNVKIYVFDDQGTPDEQEKPIHIYEFQEEAWNSYLTKTNIGQAYQVFIPYPRDGSHRAICSLRVKHHSRTNTMTLSEPADIVLSGKTVQATDKHTVVNETIVPTPVEAPEQTQIATIPSTNQLQQVEIENLNQSLNAVLDALTTKQMSSDINQAGLRQRADPAQQIQRHELHWATHQTIEQNSDTKRRHPLADSNSLPVQETNLEHQEESESEPVHPLFRSKHPLARKNSSSPTNSGLKIETIVLE